MKDSEPPIRFREWGKKTYEELGEDLVVHLEEASRRLAARPENSDKLRIFDFYRHDMRARSHVGVVAAGGTVVEILPKTHVSDSDSLAYLLALLRYTGALGTKPGDAAGLGEHRGTFLEAWISYFATELNRLLLRSFKQKYVEIEERSTFVRGRLLTERDLDGRSKISARYPVRYEIFTPNHLLNRTLKFCNRLLMKQSRSPKNRTLLRQNDFLLDEVDDAPVLARDLDRIHLDRLSREYEPILEMCRLLLENSALDLRAGRITQLAIVFDMDKLFEKFVAEFLKRNKERVRIGGCRIEKVETQKHLGKLFGAFHMNVDIVLHTSGGKYLLDTKNKKLDDERSHAGLSQSDFYQMYGYLKAGRDNYEGVILLYPKSDVSPEDASFTNYDGARLFVCTVDIAKCHDPRGSVGKEAVIKQLNLAFELVESSRETKLVEEATA